MCTVSVVLFAGGVRIGCNRDERRSRPMARPPRLRRAGARTAVYPLDPLSGGTWIGANDAGLAVVLLNRTAPGDVPAAVCRSRGTIVPRMLAAASLTSALRRLARAISLEDAAFGPFTVVLVHRRDLRIATWDGRHLSLVASMLVRPAVFTSSSLGDGLVMPPRRALFAALVQTNARPLEGQARFHHHSWPDRPEVSVLMSRPDAATVSRTFLDIRASQIRLEYSNLEPRTSNLEPRTSNLEPRTSNLEPRTSNLEPRTSNLEP